MIQVRLSSAFSNAYFLHFIYRVEILLEQAGVERASMVRNCKVDLTTPHTKRGLTRCCYSDDEIDASLRFVGAGILAMANSGPNTNGEE